MNIKALVALRKRKGIYQYQIANALGRHQSIYSRIENGKIELKSTDLPIIANQLGVSINYLLNVLYNEQKSA